MNLYFLVEGKRTEAKIYPNWLETLLPNFRRVSAAREAVEDNYFLISGKGYPRLLDVTLPDAVEEIREYGNYDFLVIVIDADEVGRIDRIDEVQQYVHDLQLDLGRCQLEIVVQDCCLESWLLGNRKVYSRHPQNPILREFVRHYDVYAQDPEPMPAPLGFRGSKADYHLQYLKQMLKERNIQYTKNYPRDTAQSYYLHELIQRTLSTPTHLLSFQDFTRFCESINVDASDTIVIK